jgi:hypothetical protein
MSSDGQGQQQSVMWGAALLAPAGSGGDGFDVDRWRGRLKRGCVSSAARHGSETPGVRPRKPSSRGFISWAGLFSGQPGVGRWQRTSSTLRLGRSGTGRGTGQSCQG